MCSPESIITIADLSLFSVFFRERQSLISSSFALADRAVPVCQTFGPCRPDEDYLLISTALLITSGGVARIASLMAWVSNPDLGSSSAPISAPAAGRRDL